MKLVAKLWLPIFAPKSGKMQHTYHFLTQIKSLLVKFLPFLWAPIIEWDDSPEILLFMHQIYFLNRLFYPILLMSAQKNRIYGRKPVFLPVPYRPIFSKWLYGMGNRKIYKNTAVKCTAVTVIRYSAQP